MASVDDDASPPAAGDLTSDRLDGVASIAAYLGWPERKVYQARERGWSTPIRKRDGEGIYAFRSELWAWYHADETLPVKKTA